MSCYQKRVCNGAVKFQQNSTCQVPKEKTVFVLAGAIVRIKMRMMFSQSIMVIQFNHCLVHVSVVQSHE